MTPDHPYFFRRVLSALTAILLAGSVFGGASVFEMPDLHVRHMRLLALMDKSHQEGDYITMEVASREGIKAGTADAVIAGAGVQGYAFAVQHAARLLGK